MEPSVAWESPDPRDTVVLAGNVGVRRKVEDAPPGGHTAKQRKLKAQFVRGAGGDHAQEVAFLEPHLSSFRPEQVVVCLKSRKWIVGQA
mmetsp:Transcript_2343/g.2921  ORF Transcript_2343/g.2921 Transcript_2343/m.2921 type:complete len:89 (-) Transcript_2343:211-477(-)